MGACAAGYVDLDSDEANGCEYFCTPSGIDVCDGIDNDCNGNPDDGTDGISCSVAGAQGTCAVGMTQCSSGSLSCIVTVSASAEVCNGLDDDCDGAVDEEGCPCAVAEQGASVYMFCNTQTQWLTASSNCAQYGYRLVTIDSAQENVWVAATQYSMGLGSAWLGINDRGVEGTYLWEDGSPVTYTSWVGSEPNNYGNEDCAVNYQHLAAQADGGGWNDINCTWEFDYVCERRLPQ